MQQNSAVRRFRLGFVGLAIAALTVAGMSVAPASGAGAGLPKITKVGTRAITADGQSFYAVQGTVKSLDVDWTGSVVPEEDPSGTWRVQALCYGPDEFDPSYTWTQQVPEAPTGVVRYPVPVPASASLYCSFEVAFVWSNDFNVSPAFRVMANFVPKNFGYTDREHSDPVFYPRVEDGYLDTWSLHYLTNAPHSAVGYVKNAKGKTVRTLTGIAVCCADFDEGMLEWDGRVKGGKLAAPGTYKISIVGKSKVGTGSKTLGPYTAKIKTGTRTVTKSVRWHGDDRTPKTKGKCYFNFYGDGSINLNCLDGGYASIAYSAKVPAKAKILSWSVSGYKANDDGRTGEITKRLTRTKKWATITVKVTKKRSYVVRSVRMKFRYVVKI